MSECKWAGSGNPRVLAGRHGDECPGDECAGCQECADRHCRVCRRVHADGTCAECLSETRSNLREIGRMCDALPEEVESRGIDGEAMMLLGPAADPEARGHLEASVLAGRVPADYLDHADHDRHPLFVLGTWDMLWRDALEHDEPQERLTLATALEYLDRQLTYMAGFEHVPFEDFARNLRQCVAHLEGVLHDGEGVEYTRVVCDRCQDGPRLIVHKGSQEDGSGDRWICPRCEHRFNHEEMLKAHGKQLRHESAQKYVLRPEAIGTLRFQGRSENTIRKWLEPPPTDNLDEVVGGYCEIGTRRVFVWWPDIWRRHLMTATRKRSA